MMKKTVAALLAVLLVLGFTACGPTDDEGGNAGAPGAEVASASSEDL